MTSYSPGRVRICCRNASAMTSLMTISSAVLLHHVPRAAVELLGAVLAGGELVAPVAEAALGELHDVALVHERQAAAALRHGVLHRRAHEAVGALLRDGLEAEARRVGEADLREAVGEVFLQERAEAGVVLRALLPLDARVDVLRVLAEDGHVDLLGLLHRARHAREVAHGAHAGVQVELLPKGHVQAPDATADGRGERPLDGHEVLADGVEGFLGEPVARLVEGLLAREHFLPDDPPRAAVGLLHRRVEDAHRGVPDVRAGAVADR